MAITGRQRAAISAYTGEGYVRINIPLRLGERSPARAHVAQLDELLASSKLSAPMTVYRGVKADFVSLLEDVELRPGTDLIDLGYQSTSRDVDVALRHAEVHNGGMVMRIHLPSGTKCFDMSPYSNYPEEEEILLQRGSRLTVLGYDEHTDMLNVELSHESD